MAKVLPDVVFSIAVWRLPEMKFAQDVLYNRCS